MKIIAAKEKHADVYWDASTPELWAASSLAILSERFRSGEYYLTTEETFGPEEPVLTKEEIAQLPTESLRRRAMQDFEQVRREVRERKEHELWYAAMKEVVEGQDLSMVGPEKRQQPRAWRL